MEADLDKKTLTLIKKASTRSLEIFDRSIVSFFNSDMKEANRNIESLNALETLCGDINNSVLKQETMMAISLNYISESIRRAGEYAGDISETAINVLVGEQVSLKKRTSAYQNWCIRYFILLVHFYILIMTENEPHIRILAAFPGFRWGKLSGKNSLDLMAFGRLLERCNSAVFWQTGRNNALFSICTETDGFTGVFG